MKINVLLSIKHVIIYFLCHIPTTSALAVKTKVAFRRRILKDLQDFLVLFKINILLQCNTMAKVEYRDENDCKALFFDMLCRYINK